VKSPENRNPREGAILTATILGSSMAFIDGTVVNVALPALQKSFHATVPDMQWVVESYALFLSALLLLGGLLGDRYGRKFIYGIGVAVFAVASGWCGFSHSIDELIIARGFQGIGGALLVPGSLAIIGASFSEANRGKAIGTWSGFTAITAAIGPVIGGWLVEHASWRAAFFINLPIAAVVLFLIFHSVPESRDEEKHIGFDWSGAILATSGLGFLVYGLIESGNVGFANWIVGGSLAVGILLLALFVFMETRVADPMLPLKMFRKPDFSGANLLTLFLYAALTGALFFFPLNLIQVQGYTATAAGASFLPFTVIMFSLSRWSGGLVKRYGARKPLLIGPAIAGAGLALFIVPAINHNFWTSFFPAVITLALGMAISVAPLTTTVLNSVETNKEGIASGINNAVSRTAGLLAIAVFGVAMLHSFNRHLDANLATLQIPAAAKSSLDKERNKLAGMEIPQNLAPAARNSLRSAIENSFVSGFRLVMLIGSMLAFASSFCTWLMIGKNGKAVSPE
jgi:EmrB/QacA subfamily drug resistance transporter